MPKALPIFCSTVIFLTNKWGLWKKIELKTTEDLVKFAIKNNIIQID